MTTATLPQLDAPPTGLEVLLLGTVGFEDAYALQVQLADQVRLADDQRAHLLIVEHPALITIGRHGSRAEVRADDAQLTRAAMPLRWVSRGGPAVLHAPGQLAIYPVLPVDLIDHNIPHYLDRLDRVMVRLAQQMGVAAAARPGRHGVWCEGGWLSRVGITVNDGVVYHGMWLNVQNDLILMRLLETQHDKRTRAANLIRQSPRRIQMHHVREAVLQQFEQEFGFERQYLFTSHPLIHRKAPRHVFVGCTE